MSKDAAATQVKAIVAADPGQVDMGAQLDTAAKSWGRYWPQVWGDLVRGGLPPETQVLGAMDRPDQAGARADFQKMLATVAEKKGIEQLKNAAPSEARTAIDNGLADRMAAFRATVRDPRLYDAVQQGVQHLAWYYAFQGRSADQALADAYDGIIGRKYDFGGTIRAPKGMLGTVERAGDAVLAELTNRLPPNFDTTQAEGMVAPGNLDPWTRPVLKNPGGGYSTTSSISIGTDAGEVLIPTVVNGQRLSNDAASAHYKSTGENFGTFKTPAAADAYATALHNAQASMYDERGNPTLNLRDIGGSPDLTLQERQQIALSAIQRGYWQTNENDTGVVRMAVRRDGLHVPAQRADGSRIEFKFADAPDIAAKAPPAGADIRRGIASAPQ